MSRNGAAWVALAAVLVGVVVVASWPRRDDSDAARARRLATELRCVDCEGLAVAASTTESADAARRDIRARIAAGESDAQIRQAFVDRFGESILLKPRADGLGFLVWGLPVVVVVLGAGGIVLALRRWQREPRLVPTTADEELVARERSGGAE